MDLIDDKGRLFGTINIIDALVVLLVLAVVAAGAAFVLGTDEQSTTLDQASTDDQPAETTTAITFEITGVQPYVADAIPEGSIESDSIVALKDKSIHPTEVIVKDQNGELHERTHPRKQTVTFQLTLNTTTTEDDEILFGDEPLEIGRQLTLDFGRVTVDGTVTNITPADE